MAFTKKLERSGLPRFQVETGKTEPVFENGEKNSTPKITGRNKKQLTPAGKVTN